MTKWFYLLLFIAILVVADAIAPIGTEPIWQTAYYSIFNLRETMRTLEDTASKPEPLPQFAPKPSPTQPNPGSGSSIGGRPQSDVRHHTEQSPQSIFERHSNQSPR